MTTRISMALAGLLMACGIAACTPTVKVQAPEEPIEINLNIRIEQEVRVKLDNDVSDLLQNNPNLF